MATGVTFTPRQQDCIGNLLGMPRLFKGRQRPVVSLDAALDHLLLSHICRWEWLNLLQGLWPQIVGDRLASNCHPSSIRGRTLSVRTMCRIASQELAIGQRQIVERIQRLPELAHINHLRVVIGERDR